MEPDNAEVDYVSAETGALIVTLPFYDPGLDPKSQYTKGSTSRRIGGRERPHMAYSCGRPRKS